MLRGVSTDGKKAPERGFFSSDRAKARPLGTGISRDRAVGAAAVGVAEVAAEEPRPAAAEAVVPQAGEAAAEVGEAAARSAGRSG